MASHGGEHLRSVVAANLRDAAAEKGLTQRQVADAVKATPAQVSHWFGGTYTPRNYLYKLAELLTDGDVSALYREREPAEPEAA